MFRHATGMDIDDEEIFLAAERVINIERAHWCRDGSARQDDTHTDRYFDEEILEGPFKGMKLDRKEWAWAQTEYYKFHGWDRDGFISPAKAMELGIDEIIPDMKAGKAIYQKWMQKMGLAPKPKPRSKSAAKTKKKASKPPRGKK